MARDGAKSTVAEATSNNSQPKVILEHGSGALAEIYAHGATVTRYRFRAAEVSGLLVLRSSTARRSHKRRHSRGLSLLRAESR